MGGSPPPPLPPVPPVAEIAEMAVVKLDMLALLLLLSMSRFTELRGEVALGDLRTCDQHDNNRSKRGISIRTGDEEGRGDRGRKGIYLKGTALTMPIGEYLVEKLPALPVADPIRPAR